MNIIPTGLKSLEIQHLIYLWLQKLKLLMLGVIYGGFEHL